MKQDLKILILQYRGSSEKSGVSRLKGWHRKSIFANQKSTVQSNYIDEKHKKWGNFSFSLSEREINEDIATSSDRDHTISMIELRSSLFVCDMSITLNYICLA